MHIILNHSSMVPIYEQLMEQILSGGTQRGRGTSVCEDACRGTSHQRADCKESL